MVNKKKKKKENLGVTFTPETSDILNLNSEFLINKDEK